MWRREGGVGRARVRARGLLSPLRVHAFRRLWLADIVSLLGDWSGRLALTVIVLERTGSPAWAAGVTAVSLAGFVGIGQLLATLADRRGRVTVMLGADLARALLFALMLLDLPVGGLLVLAFLAGLATPPFEAARSAAIPDLVPGPAYGDALALAGITVQASIVLGNVLGGGLLLLMEPETALVVNVATFLVSAALVAPLRTTAAAKPSSVDLGTRSSLRDGMADLFGDRMVRRALAVIAITGALGTVDEALVVPYADRVGLGHGVLGLLAAAVPLGTVLGTMVIPTSGDHHRLLRSASLCSMATAAIAAPLFWLEVGQAGAFGAFLVSGGMFAVSIPTNVVIGTRLRRDTRASAMGVAVGILMGSQALGAAVGGVAASWVGPPRAISVALGMAALFSAWAFVTTPYDAKHLTRRRSGRMDDEHSVIDLVALESGSPVPLAHRVAPAVS